jgi:hypothetical protein
VSLSWDCAWDSVSGSGRRGWFSPSGCLEWRGRLAGRSTGSVSDSVPWERLEPWKLRLPFCSPAYLQTLLDLWHRAQGSSRSHLNLRFLSQVSTTHSLFR